MMLGIPYEVLVKHYTASYSAARAALLDAWRYFRTRRDRHAAYFCAPIYEAWLDEAVATGYVRAPGYFASPLVRRAWLGHTWIGDGPGSIDPVKDIKAAEARIGLRISTHEAESILHDGGKLRPKLKKLAREMKLMKQLDVQPSVEVAVPPPAPQEPPEADAE
jgi:capsid protein